MSFFGRRGALAERDMREGVKNFQFLGDVLNGCSLVIRDRRKFRERIIYRPSIENTAALQ